MPAQKRVLALTTTASNVASQQDRALFLFQAHGIDVELVDATMQRDKRQELLAISGIGANYPQFFVEVNSTTEFLGEYNDIVDMNDAGLLTKEKLGLEEEVVGTGSCSREVAVPENEEKAPWLSHGSRTEKDDDCCFGLLPSWFKKSSAVKDA
jgi:hypothetical protein